VTRYLIGRFLQIPVTLLIVLILVFFAIRLAPGDPAMSMLGSLATPDEIQEMREMMGLDKSLPTQFLVFVQNVLKGEFGDSIIMKRPVFDLIVNPLRETLKLVFFTMAWVLIISIPLGILAAVRPRSIFNYVVTGFVYMGQAAPNFWLGIMLILLFAVRYPLLPSFGGGGLRHMILPSIALGVTSMARVVRFVRSDMLDSLQEDYVRTAYSKGLPATVVIMAHAFRNSLIPVVTDTGLQLGWTIGNAVVVESVFAWPGIGTLATHAITARDYPMVQAAVLVLAAIFVFLVFVVDVAYAYLDPRIRYE
jgi:peptide/nickel transport system permease protein